MKEQALEWWESLGDTPILGLMERGILTKKHYGEDRSINSLKDDEIVGIYKSEGKNEDGAEDEELEEFVKDGGAPLGGDYPSSIGDDAMTSTGNPKGARQQTTDDYIKQSQGGGSSKYMFGYSGGRFSESEPSRFKMREMVEDIFSKGTFDDDMVKKFQNGDINRNGIPSIDVMANTNPIIVRKVNLLKDVIGRNSVSGEEKAIILNHLLDMDMSDVPNDFKDELKKKL